MKNKDVLLLLAVSAASLSLSMRFNIPWILPVFFIISATIAIFLLEFENRVDSRQVAVTGTMISIIVVSRQLVHSVGGASPVFFFVIVFGYVFGPRNGFVVGALSMFVSNFFLGQGPWAPFQMVAMGLAGMFAALVPMKGGKKGIILLAVYGAAVAYLYGAITDLFMWSAFMAEKTLETYIAVFIAGAAFDTMRAAGNVLMILILGGPTVKVLSRFRKRHLF